MLGARVHIRRFKSGLAHQPEGARDIMTKPKYATPPDFTGEYGSLSWDIGPGVAIWYHGDELGHPDGQFVIYLGPGPKRNISTDRALQILEHLGMARLLAAEEEVGA